MKFDAINKAIRPLGSLPSRERGLKYEYLSGTTISGQVAPFTGAWIEILTIYNPDYYIPVAPFTGAWIEI